MPNATKALLTLDEANRALLLVRATASDLVAEFRSLRTAARKRRAREAEGHGGGRREAATARTAAQPLVEARAPAPPSARVCGLMARVSFADGQADEARAWIARGAGAPQEPDWSDLDPAGRAFAYSAGDWARPAPPAPSTSSTSPTTAA